MDLRQTTLFQEAMGRIDARGHFHQGDLPNLRSAVQDLIEAREPLDHPASLFGPWGDLGPRAQAALRQAVENDIKGTMGFFPHGAIWTGLVRGGRDLNRLFHDRSTTPWGREVLKKWNTRLSEGPLKARNRLYRTFHRRRWARGKAAGPCHLLTALERTPQWLLGDFAEGVGVDRRARGYYVDPARNVIYGYMVGLDLMMTPKGLFCPEANVQPGILPKRRAVLEGNPFVEGVLEAAEAQGVRRVLWLEGDQVLLQDWMLAAAQGPPKGTGISLEVLEDPTMASRPALPQGLTEPNRWSLGGPVPNDTLVMRRNQFPVGPDYLVNHKESFVRSLHKVLTARNETRVHVLPMTRVPLEVPEPPGPGLPNLVYKYPTSMKGRGVFFMLARDTNHALAMARELDDRTGEGPGLFQLFAPSISPDGLLNFGVRVEILLTPLGTWQLASFLRAGRAPTPAELPYGVFSEPGVFAADPDSGSDFEVVGKELEPRIRDAALAIGDALGEALESTFKTRPGAADS